MVDSKFAGTQDFGAICSTIFIDHSQYHDDHSVFLYPGIIDIPHFSQVSQTYLTSVNSNTRLSRVGTVKVPPSMQQVLQLPLCTYYDIIDITQ